MGSASSSIFDYLDPAFPIEPRFYHFDNLQNTCFCNSVLQALTSSTCIKKYFRKIYEDTSDQMQVTNKDQKAIKTNKNNNKNEIVVADIPENWQDLRESPFVQFYEIFLKQFANSKKREFYVRPKKLLRTVRKETDQFPHGCQQDSHEFLMFLLSSFDETIKKINNLSANSKNKVQSFSKFFQGKKEISYDCQRCKKRTSIGDVFSCLYIGLEDVKDKSLQDLINTSFKDEEFSGKNKMECHHCHKRINTTMKTCLTFAPKILVVQLQRFYYDRKTNSIEKMTNFVQVPRKVKLNQCNHDVHYILKTIIIHIGRGLQKGHYIALNYIGGSWILANDLALYALKPNDVDEYLGPQACKGKSSPVPYLLFYERQD